MRIPTPPLGFAALALAGSLACEPAATPVPPKTATPAPTGAVVAAAPSYDLSPVAEPADLVGLLRWKNAGASFTTLGSCAGLPPEITSSVPTALLGKAFQDGLRGQVDATQLAAAVSVEAPVDLVVALDPTAKRGAPMVAFAMGLTSLDRAKAAASATGSPLVEVTSGMWRIGGVEKRGPICVIAVSTGSTPARLVCGQREKDLLALSPYLTRTLPTTAPAAADLHAEVRVGPLDAHYGEQIRMYARGLPVLAQSQISIGDPTFDGTLVDAATALADEAGAITHDLGKLSFDVSVAPSTCVTSSAVLELRGRSSWLAGTVLDRPERAGPPPAIFWRAPRDSESVLFGRVSDPARFAGMVKTLRTLVDSALGKFHVGSADDRKALAELITIPFGKDATIVQASGRSAAPTITSLLKLEGLMDDGGDWSLIGIDEGPEAIAKLMKDVVSVYGRKGLMDPLKHELRSDARFLPKVTLTPAPASLGKDALDLEIKFDIGPSIPPPPAPGGKGAKKPPAPAPAATKPQRVVFSFHILLMPDGKNTWVALGYDKDELTKHLLMAKSTAPASDTIASRAGLELLRDDRSMSGGFVTLYRLTKMLATGMSALGSSRRSSLDIAAVLDKTPHKGDAPVLFSSAIAAGNAPRGEVTLRLTKPVIEDLGVALMALRMGGSPKPVAVPPQAPPPPSPSPSPSPKR